MRGPDELLEEQIAYYRARAPEYDDWWFKRGRFQRPAEVRRRWAADVARLDAAVDAFDPRGAVLELAAGTGAVSHLMAQALDAATIVATDLNPAMLETAAARSSASIAAASL